MVTHDWAQHSLSSKNKDFFPRNIKDIVSEFTNKNKNIFHIHISPEDYNGKNIKQIYQYPEDWASHPRNYEVISSKIADNLNYIENF